MAVSSERMSLQQCADTIAGEIEGVFATLSTIADRVRQLRERARGADRPMSSRDLHELRELVTTQLDAYGGRLNGSGFITAPGVLSDRDLYLEWWIRNDDPVQFYPLRVDLDPDSANFYNYETMAWFALPRDTGKSVVVGPYVDLNGVDMYILTFSQPVMHEGEFCGIVGADVPVYSFERWVLRPLMKLPNDTVLIGQEGRIIAANTADWPIGTLAPSLVGAGGERHRRVQLAAEGLSWSLVETSP